MSLPTRSEIHFSGAQHSGLQIGQHLGPLHYHQSPTGFRGSYFHVDLTTSPSYIPRKEHSDLINEQLEDKHGTREHRLQVISGLGGAGKSQLALNYLQQYRKTYMATFWIEANSTASIERDFSQIFSLFHPNEPLPSESSTTISRVKAKLQEGDGLKLIVFDGADDIEDSDDPYFIELNRFLPRLPGVHIILTTRIKDAEGLSPLKVAKVKEMEDNEALALFQKCSGVKDQASTAEAIVHELGNFALAITLAGCYIKQDFDLQEDLGRFLEEYEHNRDDLQHWCPSKLIHQYGRTTMSTWELSFNAIKRRSEIAAKLLTCLAFLDRTDIFIDLFCSNAHQVTTRNQDRQILPQWKELISSQEADIKILKESVFVLVSYSFLDTTGSRYSMHKLVHEWISDRLSLSERQMMVYKTVNAFRHTLMASSQATSYRNRLIPHLSANFKALRCVSPILEQDDLSVLEDVRHFADTVYLCGQFTLLYSIQDYISKNYAASLGTDHPDTLASLQALSKILQYQGKLVEAIELQEQVLKTSEHVHGARSPETLSSMLIMGNSLQVQGKYQKAENIQKQALARCRELYDEDHAMTIAALHDFSMTLNLQGRFEEALSIQRKVLEKSILHNAGDHLVILKRIEAFAITLLSLDRPLEALPLIPIVAEGHEASLGPNHPVTLVTLSLLAGAFRVIRNYEQSAAIFWKVLELQKVSLGIEHINTLTTMTDLGAVLFAQGKLSEADQLLRQALETGQRVLEENHPCTIRTMRTVVNALHKRGDPEAIPLATRAVEKCRLVYGDEHPNTIGAQRDLDVVLQAAEKKPD